MEDITPSLLKAIEELFQKGIDSNKKINRLLAVLQNGKATHPDAQEYAIEVGEALAEALGETLTADALPNGRMYYNIASRIFNTTLGQVFERVTEYTSEVQEELNKAAGLGLKTVIPRINQDRIDGLIDKVSNAENVADVSWVFNAPVVNFSQNAVDETIRANAEFQAKSGMAPRIVRRTDGNCCEWCSALAGTYSYPDVPSDVWHRHNNCGCTVEYYPGDGRRQNVHSKIWVDEPTDDRKARIETLSNTRQDRNKSYNLHYEDVTKEYLKNATPREGRYVEMDGFKDVNGEKEAVQWIYNTFGGNITLLAEDRPDGEKNPDFLWNGALWELKTPTTEKASNSAIRQGLKQIKDNPGGIMLNYGEKEINYRKLLEVIELRMQWKRSVEKVDILIKSGNGMRIYRY